MKKIKLTFITITLNNINGLTKTIESYEKFKNICNQVDIELVVVDGISTDGSLEYLRQLESMPDVLISESDKGIYDAMNKGVRAARGNFVSFMNAGDCIVADGMKSVLNELVTGKNVYVANASWYGGSLTRFKYLNFSPRLLRMPNHQAMLFPKQFLLDNPFDLRFKKSADLDNKLAAYKHNQFVFKNEVVACCEVGGVSHQMNSFDAVYKSAKEHAVIAKKHFGICIAVLNFVKAIIWGGGGFFGLK
jgi:putative colanic acid biosynthesis glycosyltransferase